MVLSNKIEVLNDEMSKGTKDIEKYKDKRDRAEKKKNKLLSEVKAKPNFNFEGSHCAIEVELLEEQFKNQYLTNAISILCNENLDIKNAIFNALQERGINIPLRPNSEHNLSESNK